MENKMKIKPFGRTGTKAAQNALTEVNSSSSMASIAIPEPARQPSLLHTSLTALAAIALALIAPRCSVAERTPDREELIVHELSVMGRQGATIARARDQVLGILQQQNACSAWYQEVDPDAAEVFRSLRFELDANGPAVVYSRRDADHGPLFKHPWGAKAMQLGGENSVVLLNPHGAFFQRTSLVVPLGPAGNLLPPLGSQVLTISSYTGDTPEAQITILLHELGHIVGRLPEDDDSWSGRSGRNTYEVLQHCKGEIKMAAKTNSKGD
jgi:hypothetical protein